jgi:hypothetical protein
MKKNILQKLDAGAEEFPQAFTKIKDERRSLSPLFSL